MLQVGNAPAFVHVRPRCDCAAPRPGLIGNTKKMIIIRITYMLLESQ